MAASVAERLRVSRAAHVRFHTLDRAKASVDLKCAALSAARAERDEADAADPDHEDAAWTEDKRPHAEIVAFYDDYLERHA